MTTDHASYPPGTTVTITGTVTNVSKATCWVPAGNCDPAATATNSAGQVVWYSNNPQIMTPCSLAEQQLAPGQSQSHQWQWNQQVYCNSMYGRPCPATSQAPAGTYYASVHWGALEGSKAFNIQ